MKKTSFWVLMALFTAIELIFCFTPLGSIPIVPGLGIVATLSHVPAILIAILVGKRAGAFLGGVFGICSLIVWSFMPPAPAVAFAFTPLAPNGNIFSLLICLLPRIFFPVVTAWLFDLLSRKIKLVPAAAIAAGVGTFVHSILVLSGIYLAFHSNAVVGGNYINFVIAWGGVNALLEIAVAAIVAAGIIVPMKSFRVSKAK